MLQRVFKRKSNRTTLNMPDFDGHVSEFSLETNESDVSDSSVRIPNRIFVGGLSSNTDEWDLRAKFSKHGQVKFVKVIRDSEGFSKGYGFVTFATEEEAKNVMEKVEVIIIKGRKLSIGPAVKRQKNPSSSCSTEKTSASPILEEPCVVSSETPKCQPKSNYLKFKDNWPGLNNWSVPYYLETSSFMNGTQLSPMDLGGNAQVNNLQPYPSYVYVPSYPYQQTAGFSYAPYGSFPDSMPVVTVPMPDYCMYRGMQLK